MATVLGYKKTYPGSCRDCGDRVFVHTNGYGDWVLFDELGHPWPLHGCFEERTRGYQTRRETTAGSNSTVNDYGAPNVTRGGDFEEFLQSLEFLAFDEAASADDAAGHETELDPTTFVVDEAREQIDVVELVARMMRRFGRREREEAEPVEVRVLGSQVRHTSSVSHRRSRPKNRAVSDKSTLDIERCEPGYFLERELTVTGFVQDLHTHRRIERLAEPNTLGYLVYRGIIGSETYSQLTVIDSDLVSYTAVIPVSSLQLQRGAMVTMRVAGRKTPGRPLFVCTSLDEIEFIRSDGVDGDRNATC